MKSTTNGIRFYPSPVYDFEYGEGNLMVSIPVEDYDSVWTIADWFKTGPRTMPVKNGRFAASFKGVYVRDVELLIRFLNYGKK